MAASKLVKSIASNTIYQIVGKVISMAITVLATIVITRYYGKQGYGEFSLMQTWPALFFIIVDFGINAIATRELSKDFSKAAKWLGNIFFIRVLFSIFFIVTLSIVLTFFPYSASLKFGIMLSLFLILTQALYTTTNIIFQVKLRYDYSTIGYVVGYLAILGLIIALSLSHSSITLVSLSYVVGGLLTFLLNYIFLCKLGVRPVFDIDLKLWRFLLVSSLPLGLMFVFSQINFKADSILMSVLPLPNKLNNTDAVALYALPYKVFEVALVIPTFFMNSVYPVMVVHMLESKERLKHTFLKSILFLAGSGIVCGIIGIIFSPFVIQFLGGSEFKESVIVLQILVGGLTLYFLTQPLSWLIVTLDKQKYLPYIYLVSALFNVAANYIFIQKYSFYASAVITHLSEFLILVLLTYFAVRSWKKKYA